MSAHDDPQVVRRALLRHALAVGGGDSPSQWQLAVVADIYARQLFGRQFKWPEQGGWPRWAAWCVLRELTGLPLDDLGPTSFCTPPGRPVLSANATSRPAALAHANAVLRQAGIPTGRGGAPGVVVDVAPGEPARWALFWGEGGGPSRAARWEPSTASTLLRAWSVLRDAGYDVVSPTPECRHAATLARSHPIGRGEGIDVVLLAGAVFYELCSSGPLGLLWRGEIVPRLERAGVSPSSTDWVGVLNAMTRRGARVVAEPERGIDGDDHRFVLLSR